MTQKKKSEDRITEILNASEKIFISKGYEATSVEDILKILNLSKGGFYYYFESKEAVLEAIISRYTERISSLAKAITYRENSDAVSKLKMLIDAIKISDSDSNKLLVQLHKPDNQVMHMKGLVETIRSVSPYFQEVAKQGVKEGSFKMEHPESIMEALLFAATIWFDSDFFQYSEYEKEEKKEAFLEMVEKCTGVQKESLNI